MFFYHRYLLAKIIKKYEVSMYTAIKLDDFDLPLHKITLFHLVFLGNSVYTDVNHRTLQIVFSIFIAFVGGFIACQAK